MLMSLTISGFINIPPQIYTQTPQKRPTGLGAGREKR